MYLVEEVLPPLPPQGKDVDGDGSGDDDRLDGRVPSRSYFDVTSPLDARGVYTFQKPCLKLRVQKNSLSPSIQSEKNMNAKQIVLPSILGKKWSKRVGAVMCHVTLVSVRPSVSLREDIAVKREIARAQPTPVSS